MSPLRFLLVVSTLVLIFASLCPGLALFQYSFSPKRSHHSSTLHLPTKHPNGSSHGHLITSTLLSQYPHSVVSYSNPTGTTAQRDFSFFSNIHPPRTPHSTQFSRHSSCSRTNSIRSHPVSSSIKVRSSLRAHGKARITSSIKKIHLQTRKYYLHTYPSSFHTVNHSPLLKIDRTTENTSSYASTNVGERDARNNISGFTQFSASQLKPVIDSHTHLHTTCNHNKTRNIISAIENNASYSSATVGERDAHKNINFTVFFYQPIVCQAKSTHLTAGDGLPVMSPPKTRRISKATSDQEKTEKKSEDAELVEEIQEEPDAEIEEEVKKVPPETVSEVLPRRSPREKRSKSPAAKDQSTLKKAAVKAHQTRMDEFIADWMDFSKYPEMDGIMLKEILVEMELKTGSEPRTHSVPLHGRNRV